MVNDLQILGDAAEDETLDEHRNAPRPDPACLYGLVGEIAKVGSATTEANAYAVAANFIAFMSCAVGRGPYMPVGNTWHHARQFILHIGRSGRGRKGDAASLVMRIEKALRQLSSASAPQVHRGGLSSREGLVNMIHDGYVEGKEEIPAVEDKRLLVVESEFANILHQGKRDGNTLSSALRDLWDGTSIKPATKTKQLWVEHPHVAIMGAITPTELRNVMASRELTNGFANRFLMVWAERETMIPFPQATSQEVVDQLAQRVLEVLNFCHAERVADRDHMRIQLSADARTRYSDLYLSELNDNMAGERITALIERRAPMLLRLAMLFALCDLSSIVEVHHIDAAMAWIRFSVDSVKFIFASAADEMVVSEVNEVADKVVEFLKVKQVATRSQITTDCFNGHTSKKRIDAALDELLTANPPAITMEVIARPKNAPGTPTKTYRLAQANCANCANPELSPGPAADLPTGQASELSEMSQAENAVGRTVRSLRTGSESTDPELGLVTIDTLLSSQSSQSADESTEESDDEEIFQ